MNKCIRFLIVCAFMFLLVNVSASAQEREDAIWARQTTETITLDGVLSEASWTQAESLTVVYGESTGLPTSGWAQDPNGGPGAVTDPTNAVVKFLSSGNNLYIAFDVEDSTVGGLNAWANWDGILLSAKRRNSERFINGEPSSPTELFYSFWYSDTVYTVGTPPVFRGFYDNATTDTVAANPAAFNAYWKTDGITNDSLTDNGWIVEMKINLDSLGIDATGPEGTIVELNFSIWDHDVTPGNPLAGYTTRTWWETPWNNDDNPGRVHISPNVTVSSGPTPAIGYDIVFPNGANLPDPVIDGVLDELVWDGAVKFDLAFENLEVRKTYNGIGPFRSGAVQPNLTIDTIDFKATVQDPVVAHISGFFKGNYLYLAGDVDDKIVQGVEESATNLMDAIVFRLGERDSLNNGNSLIYRELGVYFDTTGAVDSLKDLHTVVSNSTTEFAVSLKGNTIVNEQTAIDSGYIFELKVDLSYLGYPYPDNAVFFGALVRDGDSFDADPFQNYGTRSWFFGYQGYWSIAWGYMDPTALITDVNDSHALVPKTIELYGNYPNPFNPSTKIKFSIPAAGDVNLLVYNILGQQVASFDYKDLKVGTHEQLFNAVNLSSGVYLYRIELTNTSAERSFMSKVGKMILMK